MNDNLVLSLMAVLAVICFGVAFVLAPSWFAATIAAAGATLATNAAVAYWLRFQQSRKS